MAAAGKKLASSVYVNGTLYEAGTAPPKDVADLIENPKAWTAEEASSDKSKS